MMRPNIFVVMPRYNNWCNAEAAASFFTPVTATGDLDACIGSPSSTLLASTFNTGWAEARNLWESRTIQGFAMLHADIGAGAAWVNTLWTELERVGADVLSAVVPIKDDRGLTSVGVDDTGDDWAPRRLTMHELAELPTTFSDHDVGGPILLNTGCWVCKLGEWCLETHFQIHDCIRREDGRWRARTQPEDWDFSRQCRRLGLKLFATKILRVKHFGEWFWASDARPYGWQHDQANQKS